MSVLKRILFNYVDFPGIEGRRHVNFCVCGLKMNLFFVINEIVFFYIIGLCVFGPEMWLIFVINFDISGPNMRSIGSINFYPFRPKMRLIFLAYDFSPFLNPKWNWFWQYISTRLDPKWDRFLCEIVPCRTGLGMGWVRTCLRWIGWPQLFSFILFIYLPHLLPARA